MQFLTELFKKIQGGPVFWPTLYMYVHDNGLDFWIVNEMIAFWLLLQGFIVSSCVWSIHGTCVLSLWRTDSWQEKKYNESHWENNFLKNEQEISWI